MTTFLPSRSPDVFNFSAKERLEMPTAVFLWLQGRNNSANFLFGDKSVQASTESFENRTGLEHMIVVELGRILM
jgi:hypothetical protein